MKKAVLSLPAEKKTIGATTTVNFPELDWHGVPARVDTGAATSSFHCSRVKLVEKEGTTFLSFCLDMKKENPKKDILVRDFKEITVKNSFGNSERRYVIKTVVEVAGRRISTQLSLADRYKMSFPVLLGRRLLKGRFIVDVSV
jgi:hypothetical protein